MEMKHHEVSQLMADGRPAALPGFPLEVNQVQFQYAWGAGARRRQSTSRIKSVGKEA
jgi:hypothetical protein